MHAAWKAALKRQFDFLDDGAILIGHSIGGTIVIRTLADEPSRLTIAGIFLIAAPFVGDGGYLDLYAQAIPHAVVRRLSGRDHQLNNDMSEVATDIRRLIAGRLSSVGPIPQ